MSVFLLTFKPFSRHSNPELLTLSEQVKCCCCCSKTLQQALFQSSYNMIFKGFPSRCSLCCSGQRFWSAFSECTASVSEVFTPTLFRTAELKPWVFKPTGAAGLGWFERCCGQKGKVWPLASELWSGSSLKWILPKPITGSTNASFPVLVTAGQVRKLWLTKWVAGRETWSDDKRGCLLSHLGWPSPAVPSPRCRRPFKKCMWK